MTPHVAGACRWIVAGTLSLGVSVCTAAAVPNGVDVLSRLHAERLERLGDASSAVRPESLLASPMSPYSDTLESPDLLNDLDWQGMVDDLPAGINGRDALDTLQWDLGLTRSRPGIDAPSRSGYRDPLVAANASKADVDPDIFWHMLDLSGYAHSARAAGFAVALQILRDQIATTAPERRFASSVDTDVFRRVMQADHLDQVSRHDLHYLSSLVRYRLAHWRPGGRASTGLRALPVAYRIARVAAAYRDSEGYVAAYPCQADASPRPRYAGTGDGDNRPLCFVAATDLAVHQWYLDELQRQAHPSLSHRQSGLSRFVTIAALLAPLLDLAILVEASEAAAVSDIVAGSALEDAETEPFVMRRLTCPIPE